MKKRIILISYLLFTLFPLYWMFKISITPDKLLYSEGLQYWPDVVTWQHYYAVLFESNFPQYFMNSLMLSLTTALLTTIFAIGTGYAFSRFNFKGKAVIIFVLLLTQMFPVVMLVGPLYNLMADWHLVDSLQGLILIYVAFNLPFACFLMQSFIDAIPEELEQAAMLDGCTRLQSMTKIVLPLSLPGIGATLGFVFTAAWSELLFSLMFINQQSNMTFPAGLLNYVSRFSVEWGQMAAAMILSLLPVLLFFGYIQKFMVQGLTTGALKG